MARLNSSMVEVKQHPIKVMQFGEGNFLRAFVDYFIDRANEAGVFDGSVAIVKPISFGDLERFRAQDNIYTVILRGMKDGVPYVERKVVTSVAESIDPFLEYEKYCDVIKLPELRFVISNTTEAGIEFRDDDKFAAEPPLTYPGKLTKLLFLRYLEFTGAEDKGLNILACELIDRNGETLHDCVMKFIELWRLPDEFKEWVENCCVFCNTLVDRIVTGYPKNEASELCVELGYEDQLLDTAEPFGLWVIASPKDISAEFPLDKAGLDIVFTRDITPYRDRKVRILNGAHTSMVLGAYLAGLDTVGECMADDTMSAYMHACVFDEIIPTLNLPYDELVGFAESVAGRFSNPFIRHELLSISLNSTSKWKARVLPSITEFVKRNGKLPKHLTFSFAAYIAFYKAYKSDDGSFYGLRNGEKYRIADVAEVLDFFAEIANDDAAVRVDKVASRADWWGQDLRELPGFVEAVTKALIAIEFDPRSAFEGVTK